jgi:hypothetical protein
MKTCKRCGSEIREWGDGADADQSWCPRCQGHDLIIADDPEVYAPVEPGTRERIAKHFDAMMKLHPDGNIILIDGSDRRPVRLGVDGSDAEQEVDPDEDL